jgi:O-methyltransferase
MEKPRRQLGQRSSPADLEPRPFRSLIGSLVRRSIERYRASMSERGQRGGASRAFLNLINRAVAASGYSVVSRSETLPADIRVDETVMAILGRCRDFTMTSAEHISELVHAVQYIVASDVPGDIVECGVWRGGSSMAAAMALQNSGETSRKIFLYDTFAGMPMPDDVDVDSEGVSALGKWGRLQSNDHNQWCYASIEEVRSNMMSTGYPPDRIVLVKGLVQETIPDIIPETISLLRLDTDWYDSYRHEMVHLFPRVAERGVVIFDDYGHWQGARRAVDEFLVKSNVKLLLHRIDRSARIAIKA